MYYDAQGHCCMGCEEGHDHRWSTAGGLEPEVRSADLGTTVVTVTITPFGLPIELGFTAEEVEALHEAAMAKRR